MLLLGAVCLTIYWTRRVEVPRTEAEMTQVLPGKEAVWLGPEDADAAVLMLHGFVGSRIDFADLGDRLADEGIRVRMTRLPGHGTTPEDFARLEADDLLAAAREELDDLRQKHDRVYLVGFSMGGAIATILSAEADPPVDGTALLAPFFEVTHFWFYGLPPRTWNAVFGGMVDYVPKGPRFIKVNKRESVEHMFSYDRVPTSGAKQLDRLGDMAGQSETLKRIETPVLLLHAEGDEAADPEAAREAFDTIAAEDKRAHWYGDNVNHHLLWDYDAEDVKERVIDFLKELEAGAAADQTATTVSAASGG